ncbi:hypothetical protein A7985_19645 [Pseudoalteromonas luteoviolacea]|uniref:LamG-like jellyroll fold domain-containing protein n=1 Tax=Pseudoalteromonas luteoviolacea TaxID=43657 RepID=A0A1C0TLE0_9GAMM|nr:LamG domain-containing protein [Pseudoalteromonas luteoviolacea]MBQ4813762.1 LamG domain-containing protein [Pseudoalteromonas luteoviolacea]OCQ19636.1 hypothetical protein A7985_19645 [Pseudoalteromonas luteoviolacea]
MKRIISLLLTGLPLVFANNATANVSSEALQAHWSGSIIPGSARDVSLNAHHGALVGGMSIRAGAVDFGFNFDGNDSHIKVADSDAWAFADKDFTISFWIKPRAYDSSYTRVMSHWQWGGGSNRAWEMYIHGGKLTFDAAGAFSLKTSSTLSTDQWHHVTVSRSNGVAKVYVNGLVEDTNVNASATLNNSSTYMLIGAVIGTDGVNAHSGDTLNGEMDEIRVYHRALSDSEVDKLANPYPPSSWQPEPNTTSQFYPAATNCNMEDFVLTPKAHAYRGSYEVSQGKIMTCNLPINPGKFIERVVFDHRVHEMASKSCRIGVINAAYGSTATNTNPMTLSTDGMIDVWVYEDLGAWEAYSNGHPHNTIVLTCDHETFTGESWIRYGVIRVDYAAQ